MCVCVCVLLSAKAILGPSGCQHISLWRVTLFCNACVRKYFWMTVKYKGNTHTHTTPVKNDFTQSLVSSSVCQQCVLNLMTTHKKKSLLALHSLAPAGVWLNQQLVFGPHKVEDYKDLRLSLPGSKQDCQLAWEHGWVFAGGSVLPFNIWSWLFILSTVAYSKGQHLHSPTVTSLWAGPSSQPFPFQFTIH